MNELRKHSNANDEMKEICKNLVLRWKKAVSGEKGVSSPTLGRKDIPVLSPAAGSASHPRVVIERQNSISSLSPGSESPSTPAATPLRERTFKTDNVHIRSVGDARRDKTIELLYPGIGYGSDADSDLILNVTTRIEDAMFKAYDGVTDKYKAQFRTLLANLKTNVPLREQIFAGQVSPREIAVMSAEDLMPDKMKEQIKAAHEKSLHFSVSAGNQDAETDTFKCGKCGKRRCTYYQKQTRSADEPMTTFVTCLNCNHRWKFS